MLYTVFLLYLQVPEHKGLKSCNFTFSFLGGYFGLTGSGSEKKL